MVAVIYIHLLQIQYSAWRDCYAWKIIFMSVDENQTLQGEDLVRGHQALSRPTWAPSDEPWVANTEEEKHPWDIQILSLIPVTDLLHSREQYNLASFPDRDSN